MPTSLAEELVRAYSTERHRGVCPEKKTNREGKHYSIPIEIRAVIALWYRKRALAAKFAHRECGFIYHKEAESLELLVYNWIRTHFRFTRAQSVSMSSRWRVAVIRT